MPTICRPPARPPARPPSRPGFDAPFERALYLGRNLKLDASLAEQGLVGGGGFLCRRKALWAPAYFAAAPRHMRWSSRHALLSVLSTACVPGMALPSQTHRHGGTMT